jgi:hypothetical protein
MPLSLLDERRLLVATHNPGKAREIAALLDGRFETVDAGALGLPEPEETEATYVGNAVLKARRRPDAAGLPAIADDSGLSVWGLGGAPACCRRAGPASRGISVPRWLAVEAELLASGRRRPVGVLLLRSGRGLAGRRLRGGGRARRRRAGVPRPRRARLRL